MVKRVKSLQNQVENPYYFSFPMSRPSLFGALRTSFRSINFSGILNGTQKTLSLINQAIPLFKQVTPAFKNAKTMFKVMNEFKKNDVPKNYNNAEKNFNLNDDSDDYGEGPKFFI